MTEFKLADWISYYNPPDNTWHLIRYRGTDVSVCVTSSHNGYTVILDKEAFSNTDVVRVTLDKELSIEDTDFSRMFFGCRNLEYVSCIPDCVTACASAFKYCSSLKKPPAIAPNVTDCRFMFANCVQIETAPEIPRGAVMCTGMFSRCSNLVHAPEIPDSVTDCELMFDSCLRLEAVPTIPRSVKRCDFMFAGCRLLFTRPELPPSSVKISAFKNCPPLGAEKLKSYNRDLEWQGILPATKTVERKQVEQEPLAPDDKADLNLADWEFACAANQNGSFYRLNKYKGREHDVFVPAVYKDHTVILAKEAFSKTQVTRVTLAHDLLVEDGNFDLMFASCYDLEYVSCIPDMVVSCNSTFRNCVTLAQAPEIPMGVRDCSRMFNCCIKLTQSPVIPPSVNDCVEMFYHCSRLTDVPALSEGLKNCCHMFGNCDSLCVPPEVPSSVENCTSMFAGCINLSSRPQLPEHAQTDNAFFDCP